MMEAGDFAVEKIGRSVVITMNSGENRFSPTFCRGMQKALDMAERYDDATCLVTIGVGKHYSLGVDLDWLMAQPQMDRETFLYDLQKLLARLLSFPLVTVAALNGHSYAGGALLAVCHDHLIMRDQRGWFCLPEVKIKIPFAAALLELAKSRLPHAEHHQALVLGKRYTCEEALAAKVIQEVCPVEQLKERAVAAGKRLAGKDGLDRNMLSMIKRDLYRETYKSLMEPFKMYSKL